ncbi:MAG: hypothetical protein DWQ01_06585 [Planctomycetota bacterium]|nr:MAG: hypothetical protein DWQ01_06585 [Planctomycetota bacterium]
MFPVFPAWFAMPESPSGEPAVEKKAVFCTIPPCDNTDSEVAVFVGSLAICPDSSGNLIVKYLDVSIQNWSEGCVAETVVLDDYVVDCDLMTDGIGIQIPNFPQGAELEDGDVLGNLLAVVTIDPNLCQEMTTCTLEVRATTLSSGFPARTRPAEIDVQCSAAPFVVEIDRERFGNQRVCEDLPVPMIFIAENCEGTPLNLEVTVVSDQQTSSSPSGSGGDHFPISWDLANLPAGDPYRTKPYVIRRNIDLNPFERKEVKFYTHAYLPCHSGSSCRYTAVVKDITPGGSGATVKVYRNNTVWRDDFQPIPNRAIPRVRMAVAGNEQNTAKVGEIVRYRVYVPSSESDGLSTGRVLLSLKGNGYYGVHSLGNGFILRLAPDELTAKTEVDPRFALNSFDLSGPFYETSDIQIPNNPNLIGSRVYMAGYTERGGSIASVTEAEFYDLIP